jgi:SM-20-related protein
MHSSDPRENPVRVIDEFLDRDLYARLSRFVAAQNFIYGALSNSKEDPHGHWAKSFSEESKYNLADVSECLAGCGEDSGLPAFWHRLQSELGGNPVLIRAYANGYTYGTDGYYHQDSDRPTDRTALLFLVDGWQADWGGETSFLDEAGEISRSVLPRANRLVVFPGDLTHAGRGVSRKCTALRRVLVFKTRASESASFEALSRFLIAQNATQFYHRRGTLHDHLMRTFRRLEQRGCSRTTCLAGGLHSIYGTAHYQQQLLAASGRHLVAGHFGETIEEVAWAFGRIRRPDQLETVVGLAQDMIGLEDVDGQLIDLPRDIVVRLCLIEAANLADQEQLSRYSGLSALWDSAVDRSAPDL